MFNRDFFPTPDDVIETMLAGISLKGKTVLEPSAGSGNIVRYLKSKDAYPIACEKDPKLREIVKGLCPVIADDFLTVESHMISHVDMIVMNPPFSRDEDHILHAYEIAPEGCTIVSLCNWNTLEKTYSRQRRELLAIIENYGFSMNLGDAFSNSERKTSVEVGLITLRKPGGSYESEFEGFFLDEDPEDDQYAGIIPYNFVRDVVNRYVAAVKIYDEQLESAQKLNTLLTGYYGHSVGFQCTQDDKPLARATFKKELQKAGWSFIFDKMNMKKYSTKGLREDINKFVETQQQIPFTMRNIYRMLEIVIGTQSQRMDKALLEVFDKVTMHYDENRYNVEGWKTNSHYLVNKKFILGWMTDFHYGHGGMSIRHGHGANREIIDDFQKALCYITGKNYDDIGDLSAFFSHQKKAEFGTWYEVGFFRVRGYKKGTMHFEFIDTEVWAKFNSQIARLKGYPLFESKRKK